MDITLSGVYEDLIGEAQILASKYAARIFNGRMVDSTDRLATYNALYAIIRDNPLTLYEEQVLEKFGVVNDIAEC